MASDTIVSEDLHVDFRVVLVILESLVTLVTTLHPPIFEYRADEAAAASSTEGLKVQTEHEILDLKLGIRFEELGTDSLDFLRSAL